MEDAEPAPVRTSPDRVRGVFWVLVVVALLLVPVALLSCLDLADCGPGAAENTAGVCVIG